VKPGASLLEEWISPITSAYQPVDNVTSTGLCQYGFIILSVSSFHLDRAPNDSCPLMAIKDHHFKTEQKKRYL